MGGLSKCSPWVKKLFGRFPCPSSSLEKRGRPTTNVSSHSQQSHQSLSMQRCSITPFLEFMSFPHKIVNHDNLFPPSCPQALRDEVGRIIHEMLTNKNEVVDVYNKRLSALTRKMGMSVQSQIDIGDVFKVVKMDNYPLLRREILRFNTIMPSTVSCERCFSVIKHTIHINMNAETFIENVTNKLNGLYTKQL